jgi:creatine kinase
MFVKLFGTGARRRFSTAARAPARLQQYRHHLTLAGAALITSGLAMFSTSAYSQNDQSILAEMNQRLIRLEDAIVTYSGFLQKVNEVKAAYPGNLAMKHFDASYFHGLLPELKQRLYRVVKSGVENPDSSMGCYAMYPDDYEVLRPFFGPVIKEYHKIQGEVHHKTNWDLPADHVLDLTKLGLGTTSMRVRVGRNLDAFPLPGAQTRAQRVQMEEQLVGAFQKLMADPKYGGNYYSLTPGSKYAISPEKYQQLVDSHVMFKDMSADTYLTSAGIASDWPYGRGCYQSADGGFIVWVGEEDHLRIMCMKKGARRGRRCGGNGGD